MLQMPVDGTIKEALSRKLLDIERLFDSDVFSYYGPILDGNENIVLNIIEDLANDPNKKNKRHAMAVISGKMVVNPPCHGGY